MKIFFVSNIFKQIFSKCIILTKVYVSPTAKYIVANKYAKDNKIIVQILLCRVCE